MYQVDLEPTTYNFSST